MLSGFSIRPAAFDQRVDHLDGAPLVGRGIGLADGFYLPVVLVGSGGLGQKKDAFADLAMRFMDIRKRVYGFPEMGKKAIMVCIATTAGTGSRRLTS